MRLANTDAPQHNQRPDDTEQRPPIDYVEPGAPANVTNPILSPITRTGGSEPTPAPFRASGEEGPRVARRSVAYFWVPKVAWRRQFGDVANGLHAVIARQANGMPVGQQAVWPKAQKSTLFRSADPWDAGTTRATPGSIDASAA